MICPYKKNRKCLYEYICVKKIYSHCKEYAEIKFCEESFKKLLKNE